MNRGKKKKKRPSAMGKGEPKSGERKKGKRGGFIHL